MEKRIFVIILLVLSVTVFGYSQYASASQINAKILESKLIDKSDKNSLYNLQIEFNNPSLLFLNAGKTEFTIIAGDRVIGTGQLEEFSLPALSKVTTNGIWVKDQSTSENSHVKISGVTKYQILFTSIDVPFTYYPSYEQTRKFIVES